MRRHGVSTVWLLAVVLVELSGCAALPSGPRQLLDASSGSTLTLVDAPLVLARDRRDVAVHARDYLTLLAAEINDSGRRRLVWVAHQWSTIDSRASQSGADPPSALVLVADGRDMRLNPIEEARAAAILAIPALAPPDDALASSAVYLVDPATLDYVAHSARVSAFFPDSRLTIGFELWRDGRAALGHFVDAIRP